MTKFKHYSGEALILLAELFDLLAVGIEKAAYGISLALNYVGQYIRDIGFKMTYVE